MKKDSGVGSKEAKIIGVLEHYRRNGFNLLKTSRETGVARSTIKNWAKLKGINIQKDNERPEVANNATPEQLAILFQNEVQILKGAMLKRMGEILPLMQPRSGDMDALSRSLKILHDINQSEMGKGGESPLTNSQNFLHMVIEQIKARKNDNKIA